MSNVFQTVLNISYFACSLLVLFPVLGPSSLQPYTSRVPVNQPILSLYNWYLILRSRSCRPLCPFPQASGVSVRHSGSSQTLRSRSSSEEEPIMKLIITKEMEKEMHELNCRYIKSQDWYFRSVSVKACQAAVYDWVYGEGWQEAEAAGCLIMYGRAKPPHMGFIIMNRMGIQNWFYRFQPKRMEIRIVDNFLQFKYGHDIQCIWFYVTKEMHDMARALKRMGATEFKDGEEQEQGPTVRYASKATLKRRRCRARRRAEAAAAAGNGNIPQ